jgi:hypothetical protein
LTRGNIVIILIKIKKMICEKMDYAKDYAKMIQQMTGFYKSAIDNSVNAMTMIKKNTEKLVGNSLEQSP